MVAVAAAVVVAVAVAVVNPSAIPFNRNRANYKEQATRTGHLWGMMFWKYNPKTVMSLYQAIDGGESE